MRGMAAQPVQILRNDYSSTNVTTSAYVELDSALNSAISEFEVFDSGGNSMVLAIGPAGSEVDTVYVPPGGLARQAITLSEGARLSIKAVGGNSTSGELLINFWR